MLVPLLLVSALLFPRMVLAAAMKLTIESHPPEVGEEEFITDSQLIDAPPNTTYWLQCVFTETGKTRVNRHFAEVFGPVSSEGNERQEFSF